MLETSHAVRAHRSVMAGLRAIDNEPLPTAIEISDELRAQALADYRADCRATPNDEWQPFDEYLLEWLDARLYDDNLAMWEEEDAAECAAVREVERVRQRELPFDPYSDDDDYPF